MLLDKRQGLLLIYGIPITCMCLIFAVPCESNTQKAGNKRLKIGMHLEISEKITNPWEDLGNLNFLHILFTSVIMLL